MNDRIQKLREASLKAKPSMTAERAFLLTKFYKNGDPQKFSIPVSRAMSLYYIMANKKIYIAKGELIIGEKGPKPKATPTYPEICIHSLDDLNILDTREKITYSVDDKTRKVYKD